MSYASQILARNPQAYYRLDDTGTVAHDISGNGYDATVTGATYSQVGIRGDEGDTAMLFTASGGLTLPSTFNPFTWSTASLEFWVNMGTGWHHVVQTVDNANGTIFYLDGAVTTPGTSGSVFLDTNFDMAGSLVAGGTLDEVVIYNFVLTPQQVLLDYTYIPSALFPATNRRLGILPSTSRRSGLFPSTGRRQSS